VRAFAVAAGVLVALFSDMTPSAAEHIVASLSTHRVVVTTSFTGTDLVLFGTIERDGTTVSRPGTYDIVAGVTGPRQTIVMRRKERILGVTVNGEARIFEVPTYFAILSSRSTATVTSPDTIRQLHIGAGDLPMRPPDDGDVVDAGSQDPYRAALQTLRKQQRLYVESPNGVTFLTPSLFRASIPIPAGVPVGTYGVEVGLFTDGVLIARTTTAIEIVKEGFGQFVVTAARDHGLAYGLASAAMALMTGWLASIVFRRN